jgi:hypothetical protein
VALLMDDVVVGKAVTADVAAPVTGLLAESRALLIGVSAYEYAEFPPIRAARNSLRAMRSVLADPALCGWPPDRITVIANPVSAADLATDLADLADATTGVLLLYYVGHGVLSARGELCLTVTSTRPDRPKISGLPWDTLADVLRGSPASTRLAILDCCFAGQAIEALAGDNDPGLADITHIEGVYTLTATTRNRAAHVPPPGRQDTACTSFTGELRDLIRSGIPGKAPYLTFADIYPVLRQRLRSKGLPAPGQRGTGAASQLTLTANAALASGQPGNQDEPTPSTEEPRTSRHASIVADALRAAHSVGDECAKAQALAAIARALAPVDPDRAARLAVDADRVAQALTRDGPRGDAVAAVAGPLATVDPDRAERSARSLTKESAKARALAAVARSLAPVDPDRAARLIADAERLAESVTDPVQKASGLAGVADGLAVIDPDRAEQVARSAGEPTQMTLALVSIARSVAAADPDWAARLIADAERLTQAISGATFRAPAVAAVARELSGSDDDRAARLIVDAERLAQSIPDPNGKGAALAAVAAGLAVTDPERAELLAQSITAAGARALALAAVAEALTTRQGRQAGPA